MALAKQRSVNFFDRVGEFNNRFRVFDGWRGEDQPGIHCLPLAQLNAGRLNWIISPRWFGIIELQQQAVRDVVALNGELALSMDRYDRLHIGCAGFVQEHTCFRVAQNKHGRVFHDNTDSLQQ